MLIHHACWWSKIPERPQISTSPIHRLRQKTDCTETSTTPKHQSCWPEGQASFIILGSLILIIVGSEASDLFLDYYFPCDRLRSSTKNTGFLAGGGRGSGGRRANQIKYIISCNIFIFWRNLTYDSSKFLSLGDKRTTIICRFVVVARSLHIWSSRLFQLLKIKILSYHMLNFVKK